ncbi:MAG: DNA-binding protein [Candidatus Schekmanbacteria bacterium]|nr:MAG: DNA-binding protein [Candidatus Schekmanbacteria bacterium]
MNNEYKIKRIIVGKLPYGEDLLRSMTEVCREKNVRIGTIQLIGAVKEAAVGFYDQQKKEYIPLNFYEPLEIVSSFGNVSIKDDDIFVHLHVTLSKGKGNAIGGHLLSPTKVFACEYSILELEGKELIRKYDETTGLYLWDI